MFKERSLVIATKHAKEKAIAPILEEELGVLCFVPENFDTDTLGTFTGEINRKNDPITTARNKCLLAMEHSNCDLAIASEGSFGSHPSIFFATADDEILLFLDKKNDLEIVVRELSTETNFQASEIKTEKELIDFAEQALFPSHGLILRQNKNDFSKIEKGIIDWTRLSDVFNEFVQISGTVYAETDMRAQFNPLRMAVIQQATKKLAAKIQAVCPNCKTPGFGITDAQTGLPCSLCDSPTRSTLKYIYTCQKCEFMREELFPNGKTHEEPMYCDSCNP